MQDHAQPAAYATPKLPPDTFLATIWALTAFAFLFVPARLYARWTTFHRFYNDDYLVLFAWTLSLAITASVTALNPITYQIIAIGSRTIPIPPNADVLVMRFSRVFFVVPMLLYMGLWSIKLAFLLFFKRLGTRSVKNLQCWWLVVLGITVVSFACCFTTLPYRCCLVSYEVLTSSECGTQGWSFISMKVNCGLDVFTDFLIMTIPFFLLRKVRISRQQKTALSCIFSLVIFTIVFAIVRATLTTLHVDRQMDPIWMYLWTSVELNVAIIVACIAPYRTLFLRERNATPSPLHARRNNAAFKLWTSTREEDIVISATPSNLAPWVDRQPNNGKDNVCRPREVGADWVPKYPRLGVIPSISNSLDETTWSERNQEDARELKEVQKHILDTIPKVYIQQ